MLVHFMSPVNSLVSYSRPIRNAPTYAQCKKLEYVVLKTHVPVKRVSGSEALYGPVGYINVKDNLMGTGHFSNEETVVDIYRDYADSRADQVPPQTATEPMNSFSPQPSRYTQPFLAHLVNHQVCHELVALFLLARFFS